MLKRTALRPPHGIALATAPAYDPAPLGGVWQTYTQRGAPKITHPPNRLTGLTY